MKGIVQSKPVISTTQAAFNQATELSASGTLEMNILYEYLSVAKINSVPTNATAYRRRPGFNILLLANWAEDTPENHNAARDGVGSLADIFSKSQADLSEADKVGYANYGMGLPSTEIFRMVLHTNFVAPRIPDYDDTTGKAEVLFAENYPRLQTIKKKYDPENVFSKWFAITPAA